MIGSGTDDNLCRNNIIKYNLQEFVERIPEADQENLSTYFQMMDLFVFPTHGESLGLVALEAMSCGTPVLASDLPITREYILEGENGYLAPMDNSGIFADKILKYIELPEKDKIKIRKYCSEFAEKHRYQCVFEFSGLGISEYSEPSDIEERLKQCTNGEHDAELESGCIKSVSAVGAQHELAISQTITFPEHILDLPDELRQAYILGAGSEMNQYIISGAERDWKSFCLNFTQESDVELCNTIFNG
jgi:hypothetical protein